MAYAPLHCRNGLNSKLGLNIDFYRLFFLDKKNNVFALILSRLQHQYGGEKFESVYGILHLDIRLSRGGHGSTNNVKLVTQAYRCGKTGSLGVVEVPMQYL